MTPFNHLLALRAREHDAQASARSPRKNAMRPFVAITFSLLFTAHAAAQEKNKELIDALQKLDARVFKPGSADAKLRSDALRQMRDDVNKKDVELWRAVKTKADWEKFRDERLAKLRESLGTFPETPKSVKVVTTKKLQGDGCTVECIIYESRPGFYVTANLYVPDKTDKPMPGFIIVHSHHNPKTQGELQDMGLMWARQGCLVLIPDMLGHGERRNHPFVDATSYPEKYEVSRQDYRFRYNSALQLHLVGESLMGWMVWDLMRSLDVLYQRPNIDKSKIMVFGSVAGGGDPCAVFAALDKRVTAAAPFNFGGPQPETAKLGEDAEFAFNYMGGGSWESTRNLRLSARDGFLPWLIVGSIAPRGLVYGHEFAWDDKRDPVWARFNKIWGFYDAADNLASAKGRGSVKGTPPESTHCNNIGFEHRKGFYPTLTKWFGLPIPEENKKRFQASELQCWTEDAKNTLKPKLLHQMARELAFKVHAGGEAEIVKQRWTGLLGISDNTEWALRKLEILGVPVDAPIAKKIGFRHEMLTVRHEGDATLAVPMVILRPTGEVKVRHVVVGIAQDGKAGFLKHRAETIAELLQRKAAVCLVDLRGTGETAPEGRGRQSGGTSYSASLLMHGQTVPGVQLQELMDVMNALPQLGYESISLWGDSFAEPNDPKMNFARPLDVSNMPRQSEPMGGLLALLGGAFGGDKVKAVYVRGGLVSYRSTLDSPFCYFPHDAVIPGVLPACDIDTLAAANAKHALRMEALVDGFNRRVDQVTLGRIYGKIARAEPSSPAEVAAWLMAPGKK
jgi:dienelactone hydrolase